MTRPPSAAPSPPLIGPVGAGAHRRGALPALAGLLLASAGLHLWSLTRYPAPYVDDAFVASGGWGLLQTGLPYGPLQAGVMEEYPGYWVLFSWLNSALQAIPLALFGLDLFAARLAPLAAGLLLLLATYRIGHEVAGPRLGLLAAGLVSLSGTFFNAAHLARPDIWVAALGYAAVAIYLTVPPGRPALRGLLAGLLVGLAFEVHPNGAIFGPLILALSLFQEGWRALRSPRLWAFVGGAAALLLIFVAVHILPYPASYAAIAALAFDTTKTPPLLDASQWLSSLRETALLPLIVEPTRWPLAIDPGRIALVAIAGVVLARSRRSADRMPLLLFGVLLLQVWAILPYKPHYYAILVTPAADLMVALLVLRALERPWRGTAAAHARTLGLAGLLVASLVVTLLPLREDAGADYRTTIARIRPLLPPGARLLGEPTYWFGLHDHHYVAWLQLTYLRRHLPGSSLEAALDHFRPDIVILDQRMAWHLTDEPARCQPWSRLLALPRGELEALFARRAELLQVIPTRTAGAVYVYRWHAPSPARGLAAAPLPAPLADHDACRA